MAVPLLLIAEVQRHRVDTVPLICRRRISLALENMTQMSTTVIAHNLNPLHAKRAILIPSNSARNGIEESRPAAPRLELVGGLVEGC